MSEVCGLCGSIHNTTGCLPMHERNEIFSQAGQLAIEISSLRAKLEEAREEIERMRVGGDGSEEHPFTRQFIGKCFKRHDSLLSFGVCERDDGFELTVDAIDGVRRNYAIMPDGSICDLDKLANTKAQPQTGGVDNGGDLQQALDDLRAESPAKEDSDA
jgi:hypothetical protein